jgi:hypothetical protein
VTINNKSCVLLACGFLLVLIGSAPLNGYVGFLLWPSEFYRDAFVGSIAHLLLGVVPWLLGTVLIVLGSNKARHILAIGSISLSLGCFIALSSVICTTGYKGLVGWLTIVAIGVLLAATARRAVNMHDRLRAASVSCR